MSVLGNARDETIAMHFVKIYCLPILLYVCETCSLSYKLKLGTHYPCPRAVFTGRDYGP